jgi:hypothetical protein
MLGFEVPDNPSSGTRPDASRGTLHACCHAQTPQIFTHSGFAALLQHPTTLFHAPHGLCIFGVTCIHDYGFHTRLSYTTAKWHLALAFTPCVQPAAVATSATKFGLPRTSCGAAEDSECKRIFTILITTSPPPTLPPTPPHTPPDFSILQLWYLKLSPPPLLATTTMASIL